MYCKYGTFNFQPYECSLGVSANFKRSERGFKTFQEVVFRFVGEVIETDQYLINSRYSAIANAFSIDGQSCGLVHDNGTQTSNWMPNYATNPLNYTDVQVIDMKLPETRGGEFISGRGFEITVASLYRATESSILAFRETIERTGNAGAAYKWEKNKFWGNYPVLVDPATTQVMVQQGYAIGVSAYPFPQTPIYQSPFLNNRDSKVDFIGPDRYRKGHFGFKTTWRYVFTLPTFDDVTRPALSPIV